MKTFHDIVVAPTQAFYQRVPTHGPIWPDFDNADRLRHCRNGRPADKCPTRPEGPLETIETPCVWGGFLDRHFGHLVAEHFPRLPFSLRERPDDLYLFTVEPGVTAADLPAHIHALLTWVGLAQDQVRVVTRPTAVATLRAGPQAEMLAYGAPMPGYIDLLERIAERNALVPDAAPILYVTRAGSVGRGSAGHIGEAYLAAVLSQLGVAVIDPSSQPLEQQLAAYAGAEKLVFAEGSAMHGRQILGRIEQDIHVLRRRPNWSIGKSMLTPRCRSLVYHDTAAELILKPRSHRLKTAATLYDIDRLFESFDAIGLDLRPHWDDDAYRAAAMRDLDGWFTYHRPARKNLGDIATALIWAGLEVPASALRDRHTA